VSRRDLRTKLTEPYWVIPAVCVVGAGGLAALLIEVDKRLERERLTVAFTGGPESARSLLGAIAASMLTLTALVFSITVVVLQLASTQFSPRVLRTFLQDRQNQLSLGVFAATFVYALVALRAVRGQDGLVDRFVPGITIAVAFGLVLVSVALFIAYIHRITQSIRVSNIIDRISTETESAIDRVSAQRGTRVRRDRPAGVAQPQVIRAARRGVLIDLDESALVTMACDAGGWIDVPHRFGTFAPAGATIAFVHAPREVDEAAAQNAFSLSVERSMDHDPAFGFRQLVDIAERALSPGINDPSTAVQCLDQLHHLLRVTAAADLPTGVVEDRDGEVRLVVATRRWEDYLSLSLDEIRVWGGRSLQVHHRLQALLHDLLADVGPSRRDDVLGQLALLDATATAQLPAAERQHLARQDIRARNKSPLRSGTDDH